MYNAPRYTFILYQSDSESNSYSIYIILHEFCKTTAGYKGLSTDLWITVSFTA